VRTPSDRLELLNLKDFGQSGGREKRIRIRQERRMRKNQLSLSEGCSEWARGGSKAAISERR
jgi:hypothetical protein